MQKVETSPSSIKKQSHSANNTSKVLETGAYKHTRDRAWDKLARLVPTDQE